MTAATLNQVCERRYLLGLGASTRALAEGFHDTAFEQPAAKLRDTVTKVRALLAGQPAQPGHVPAARPLRLGQPPAPDLPIWVAALGQHTTRVAAELGDGWIPALVARDRLPGWTAQLRQLRDAATPHTRPLTVAAGPITAVDEKAGAARDIAVACTAWYLGAMGEVYARSVSGQGYAAEVQAIIAANPRPSPRGGPSHPAPSSASTSSPPTEPAIRSASNSSPGTAQPTSSPSCCHPACPGPASKRPSWPQHQAPDRCTLGACPPAKPVRPLPRRRPTIFRYHGAQDNAQ